jgi:hypothetical protein
MTQTLQRLRCAKCGEYYWADERHRCRSSAHLVLARRRRTRVEPGPWPTEGPRARPLGVLGPGEGGSARPPAVETAALRRRVQALEAQIDELRRASDALRGNDSEYEAALELLVAEVLKLKDSLSQTSTVGQPADSASMGAPATVERKLRRRMRRPSPPRRHTAMLMMWVAALAVIAAGLAGLVLARMLG